MAPMKNLGKTIQGLLFSSVLGLAVAGCGSACKDLANRICDCQPTRAKQDQCKKAVDASSKNFSPSDEEESRCDKLLKQCTCELIRSGNYHAQCGLSNPE
jgi:hypothetical protein